MNFMPLKTNLAGPGYESLVQCPFNASHQILPHRMQTHLIKCAKQYPDVKLERCPFDQTHLCHPHEFEAHKAECPNRKSFDQHINLFQNKKTSVQHEHNKKIDIKPPPIHVEESWDDLASTTYNPRKHLEKYPVIRNCIGMTPSERREFRAKEKERIENIRLKELDE